MFAANTKVLVKSLGAEDALIYNGNVNEKIQLLTLVKVTEKSLWSAIRYSIMDQTLVDLLEEEEDFSPDYTEEVVIEDFRVLRTRCGKGSAAVSVQNAATELKVSAAVDSVDSASSYTLKKKTVDVKKLRKSFSNRKINRSAVNMLRLKPTEKLMFVYQTVYNANPVTLHSKAAQSGSFSAVCKMFFSFSLSDKQKEERNFKVPKESTFAYGLMEITTEDGTVGIPSRSWEFKRYSFGWWSISSDEGEDSCQTLRKINRDLKKKAGLLRPLASLPDPTRRDLLRSLQELLQDRDDLTLLEQTLDQGSTNVSPPVSAVMDLLKASNASSSQKAALQLLVSAMDTLPDRAPALLSTCSPDVLRVLSQLVDSLQENTQAQLPESPPPPLQVDGELCWAAELLCVTDDGLRELSDQWDRPELPPGVLLELLCLVVRGLSLMQPTTHL